MKYRSINQLTTIIVIAIITSCQSPGTLTEKDKQAITGEALQALFNYYNDIGRSGLLAEFAYLDSSAEFFWVPPGYDAPLSYDAVARILRQNAGLYSHITNSWDTLRIIPLTKEHASYTGQLFSIMTDTSGKTDTFRLIETGVLIKRADGWKLLHGQTAILPE